jgi:hypothetical protein
MCEYHRDMVTEQCALSLTISGYGGYRSVLVHMIQTQQSPKAVEFADTAVLS